MQAFPQFQPFPATSAPPASSPTVVRAASKKLLAVGAVGALVAALTWRAGPGLGWAVSDTVLAVALLVGVRKRRPTLAECILGGASVWLAALSCWRASEWALATALPAGALALAAQGVVAARRIRADRFGEIGRATLDALLAVPAGTVDAVKMPIAALDAQARSRASQVVRGALLGLPLACLFALLLVADRSFADLLGRMAGRMGDGVELASWTAATTAGLLLAFAVLERLEGRPPRLGSGEAPLPYRAAGERADPTAAVAPRPRLRVLPWSVVLVQLVVVFALYVVANARSLFAGHELLRARGTLTYSQYVHQGFFEVAVATGLAVACVVAGHGFLRPRGGTGPVPGGKALAAIELTLLALVALTLASSVHRLALYEQAYGYTELRLGVRLAQMAVAGLIALTAARCVLRAWQGWGAALAWSGVAFALLVGSVDADGWVARHDVARARAGGGLDVAHLATLSEDARDVLGDLRELDPMAAEFLASSWAASAEANHGRDWRSWRGLGLH